MNAPKALSRSKRWRWAMRLLLGFITLAILLFITAEIIFHTNLPRNLVISAVEKQTGLRFSANSLATGFMGHTTLYGVSISLPLSDKPFLEISQMSLQHTWLPALLLGGDFTLKRVDLDSPYLTLRQGTDKTWNFQQVAQLLTPQNPNNKPDENVLLPVVNIQNATVYISDGHNRSATIEHVQFEGEPKGLLLWQCRAQVPDHIDITGKIATGRVWAHEIDFQLSNLKTWLTPWVPNWSDSAKFEGAWIGRVDSGNVQGQLTLTQAGYRNLSLTGPIQISTTAAGAQFQPAGALLRDANAPSLDTQFTGGNIVVSTTGVQVKNVSLQFPRGAANVDGSYQIDDRTATLHIVWRDLAVPSLASHSGDFQLNFSATNSQPRFDATLRCQGVLQSHWWDSAFVVRGGGNLQNLDTTITAKKLVVSSLEGQSLDLSGFVAEISATHDGLLLHEFQIGNSETLTGLGGYTFSKKIAWLAIDGRQLNVPGHAAQHVDLDLNLWTDPQHIHLSQLYLSSGPVNTYLDGDYVFNLPKPVTAHLTISQNPLSDTDDPEQYQAPFASYFQSDLDITGTIAPLDLAFTGTANGTDLQYRDHWFGDMTVDLSGAVHDNQITLASENIQLLGGKWTVNGTWPVHNSLFRIDNLSVQHLALPLATGDDQIAGTLDGKWSIDVRELSLTGFTIDGASSIHNLSIHGDPNLTFDEIDAPRMRVGNGWIKTGPMTITKKSPTTRGSAQLRVITTIENPKRLWINLTADSWPLVASTTPIPSSTPSPDTPGEGWGGGAAEAHVTAKAKLEVDLASKIALGNADVAIDALLNSQSVATVQSSIDVNRRAFAFNNIKIASLNSIATGKAQYDVDHPFQSRADLAWNNFDLAQLQKDSDDLKPLRGKVTGSLHISPATDPRPLGPLQFNLNLNSDNVKFKNIALGDFQAAAFIGPDRIVLNDSPDHPTQLAVAGGFIHFWGRVTRHVDDIYQTQLQANLQNLDLDMVIPAGAKTRHTPGLLSGQITVVMQPHHPELTFGQGLLRLEHSDLAGTGPIAFIYNLLHILHSPSQNAGRGSIDFAIQGRKAIVNSMRYFDRGAEIRVSGTVNDLPDLPHSSLNLIALASARPLKLVDIPGISEIDQALSAVQNNALTVEIQGFLDKPTEKQVLFSDVSQDLKNLLFGQSAYEQNLGE